MIYLCEDKKFVEREFTRMGFDVDGKWRISDINKNFELCNTYPRFLIIPASFKDEDLDSVAKFRYFRRIPVAVWRHIKNGCFIARSSQPTIGLFGWFGWFRSEMDEQLIQQFVSDTVSSAPNNNINHNNNNSNNNNNNNNNDNDNDNDNENSVKSPLTCPPQPVTETNNTTTTTTNNNNTNIQTNKIDTDNNLDNNTIEVNDDSDDLSSTTRMLIIDARSYAAAMANRAKGGGCEHSEYYQRCEIQFMDLANIHSIRKSFQSIRAACEAYSEQSNNWLNFLESSRWLHHISALIRSALLIVDTIDLERKSILIHCSDGWDRTPQLVALAEIMLDPYYRTLEGFKTLIKREWLDFGHKFADRCGSNPCNADPNERCPVFLQWLDCVQQMLIQYPTSFEFNTSYLVRIMNMQDKLNRHTYSNVFGTFAHNSTQERSVSRIEDKFASLWDYFDLAKKRFTNDKFCPNVDIIRPSYKVRDLHFWLDVYKVFQCPVDRLYQENY